MASLPTTALETVDALLHALEKALSADGEEEKIEAPMRLVWAPQVLDLDFTPKDVGGFTVGSEMTVYLGIRPPAGPASQPTAIDALLEELGDGFTTFHLLHDEFGGTADDGNLVPLTKKASLAHFNQVKQKIKNFLLVAAGTGQTWGVQVETGPDAPFFYCVKYTVAVDSWHGEDGPTACVPLSLTCEMELGKFTDGGEFKLATGDDEAMAPLKSMFDGWFPLEPVVIMNSYVNCVTC